MTSGLQKGDLIIVAARPAMGKTSFCLNIAQHASLRTGETVGIFSLEMSKEQLVLRMLCSDARVDAHRLRTGQPAGEGLGAPGQGLRRPLERPHLHRRLGHAHAARDARQVPPPEGRARPGPDHRGLPAAGVRRGRVENRQQEISAISRSLKGLAKELDVPVIALSQLSRAPEARTDRRPQLSDLRESGAIEQDADVVMFIYREEEYKPTEENRGIAEIIIGKQRNGPTGTVKLAFIKEFTRFENLEWRSRLRSVFRLPGLRLRELEVARPLPRLRRVEQLRRGAPGGRRAAAGREPDARCPATRGAQALRPRSTAPRPPRVPSGIDEFDRVLGGGIVPGSMVLIGGEPGIGKSTLLLQVAHLLGRTGGAVLYVSGEESERQIKLRGERLGIAAAGCS